MRLVPWGQMLADVQASGFTPISWLRFSSRTALTTTCTASNIRAADSWREGGGGAGWQRGSSAGHPTASDKARPSRNVEPGRQAVRTGLGAVAGVPFPGNQMAMGKKCMLPVCLGESCSLSPRVMQPRVCLGKGEVKEGWPRWPAGSPPQGDVRGPEGTSCHLCPHG